jgi:hypothetical protein
MGIGPKAPIEALRKPLEGEVVNGDDLPDAGSSRRRRERVVDHLGAQLPRPTRQLDGSPPAVPGQIPDASEPAAGCGPAPFVGDRDDVDAAEPRQLAGQPLEVDGGPGPWRPAGKSSVEQDADRPRVRREAVASMAAMSIPTAARTPRGKEARA